MRKIKILKEPPVDFGIGDAKHHLGVLSKAAHGADGTASTVFDVMVEPAPGQVGVRTALNPQPFRSSEDAHRACHDGFDILPHGASTPLDHAVEALMAAKLATVF